MTGVEKVAWYADFVLVPILALSSRDSAPPRAFRMRAVIFCGSAFTALHRHLHLPVVDSVCSALLLFRVWISLGRDPGHSATGVAAGTTLTLRFGLYSTNPPVQSKVRSTYTPTLTPTHLRARL